MNHGMQLGSLDALRNFKSLLISYRYDIETILLSVELEAQRAMAKVEDSLQTAEGYLAQCRDEVIDAKANLRSCQQESGDEGDGEHDCGDEELALDQAIEALQEAKDEVASLRTAQLNLEEAIAAFHSEANTLKLFLECDISLAVNFLSRKIDTVEQYLALASPSHTATPMLPFPLISLALSLSPSAALSLNVPPPSSVTLSSPAPPVQKLEELTSPAQAAEAVTADYSALRKRTPSPEIRKRLAVTGSKVDPIYGQSVAKLEPDHIVPVSEIVKMPGFEHLPLEKQIDILNLPINFLGVSREVNASRGDRSWQEWRGHSRLGPVPDRVRETMIQREKSVRLRIQHSIDQERRRE